MNLRKKILLFFMFFWTKWNDNLLCSSPLGIQSSKHCVSIIMLFPFEIFFSFIHKFLFSSLLFSPVKQKQKRKPKNAIKIFSFFHQTIIIDEKLQRKDKKHFQFFLWLCQCCLMLPMLSTHSILTFSIYLIIKSSIFGHK